MGGPLDPVFIGHVASTRDALLLFEACLRGILQPLTCRPLDRERPSLIKSGNIFIYEEHVSGIKRWTDGLAWSPSRVLGNFLVYRELKAPCSPNEKRQARKSTKNSRSPRKRHSSFSEHMQRSLVGSLVDSYAFKANGLVKKTISVAIGGVPHRLVSYYSIEDAMNQHLATPSSDPRLKNLVIRPDLLARGFHVSLQDEEAMPMLHAPYPFARRTYPFAQSAYPSAHGAYEYEPMQQAYSTQMSQLPAPWNTKNVYQTTGAGIYVQKISPPPPYQPSSWNSNSYNEPHAINTSYNFAASGANAQNHSHNPYGPPPSASHPPAPYITTDYRQQHQQPPYSPTSDSGSGSGGTFSDSNSPQAQLSPLTPGFMPQSGNFESNGFQYFPQTAYRQCVGQV